MAEFEKALAIKPDFAEAHNNLGNVFKELGRTTEAISSYRKTLTLQPDFADSYYNLGNLYQDLGELQKALDFYQKAVDIKPNFSKVYNNMGIVFNDLGELVKSVKSLTKAAGLEERFPDPHHNLGNTLQDLGKLDEAMVSYQRAIDLQPNSAEAFSDIWLALHPLCYEILTGEREGSSVEHIIDQLPTPPEPDILRLQFNTLTGGNVTEAWDQVAGNMPTIESETLANESKPATPPLPGTDAGGDKKMAALLHFGRSGTGYLHSLLDSHPAISTLPGVYMSGFFGREVWSRMGSEGIKGLAEHFSSLYEVLFDARAPNKVPPPFVSDTYANNSVGVKEGFVKMGSGQDTPLTLDRDQFVSNLDKIIEGFDGINQGQLFTAIHQAYEETLGHDFGDKNLILYHLHYIDPYSMANFLKYFPHAHLLMMIRNPLQSCESWVSSSIQTKKGNAYDTYTSIIYKITPMLTHLNSPVFSRQSSIGLRLEDIKTRPEETMRRLCDYLGIEEAPSLYESTMQGLQWWGDPSSSLFGRSQTDYDHTTDPTGKAVGTFFSSKDQFILGTLFYPLSSRFGYVETDGEQFKRDLSEVRPLLDKPLDFEETLAKEFPPDYPDLQVTGAFKHLRAVLIAVWSVLDDCGTYPNLLKSLPER